MVMAVTEVIYEAPDKNVNPAWTPKPSSYAPKSPYPARGITGRQEVTKEDHQLAKAVNFGLLYGQGAKGLQDYTRDKYEVEMSPEEAAEYRERWFEAYPAISGPGTVGKVLTSTVTPSREPRAWDRKDAMTPGLRPVRDFPEFRRERPADTFCHPSL